MTTDSDNVRARLGPEIEARAVELNLQLQEVAQRAQMTTSNLHKIRRGKISLTPLTKKRLEDALEWSPGHIDQLFESWSSGKAEPLPELILRIYEELVRGKMSLREAQRQTREIARILDQDEDALLAAIECGSTPQG